MFSCYWRPIAQSNPLPPASDNQNCLQTLPTWAKVPLVEFLPCAMWKFLQVFEPVSGYGLSSHLVLVKRLRAMIGSVCTLFPFCCVFYPCSWPCDPVLESPCCTVCLPASQQGVLGGQWPYLSYSNLQSLVPCLVHRHTPPPFLFI